MIEVWFKGPYVSFGRISWKNGPLKVSEKHRFEASGNIRENGAAQGFGFNHILFKLKIWGNNSLSSRAIYVELLNGSPC
jgi:hypothetical protein